MGHDLHPSSPLNGIPAPGDLLPGPLSNEPIPQETLPQPQTVPPAPSRIKPMSQVQTSSGSGPTATPPLLNGATKGP